MPFLRVSQQCCYIGRNVHGPWEVLLCLGTSAPTHMWLWPIATCAGWPTAHGVKNPAVKRTLVGRGGAAFWCQPAVGPGTRLSAEGTEQSQSLGKYLSIHCLQTLSETLHLGWLQSCLCGQAAPWGWGSSKEGEGGGVQGWGDTDLGLGIVAGV